MRLILKAVVLASLISPAPLAAENAIMHRPVSTIYDLYLGGVRAGELTIDARFDGDRYRATSVMRTAGIVGALYDASFEAAAEGRLGEDGLEPARFQADSRAGGDRQSVVMTYDGRAPASVHADPAFDPKPWQIEPTDQAGTLDPVTGALTALGPAAVAGICNRSVEVFDGRRRYALDLGAPQSDGGRISCPALYRRVAGYKAKELEETIAFTVWFEERPDGLAHVVRAAGDSVLGLAVVLLRE